MCDKDEKCDLTNFSEYDKKINELKKDNIYHGTILVCIVYGLFAVAIVSASYFNDRFRELFFNEFIIFTIIFIIGAIIIIAVLVYYITNYKPKKTRHVNAYETYSCPDYWDLVMLDDSEVAYNFGSNVSKDYFKYKCVLNNKIFDKNEIYKDVDANQYLNYGITNNLLLTKTDGTNAKSDIYSTAAGYVTEIDKINANIKNSNLGHLYKNINDTNNFPTTDLLNNKFAYTTPGNITNNLDTIKDKIIDTSLIMNNYQYDDKTQTYSDINRMSYKNNNNNDFDRYILWNSSNLTATTSSYSSLGTKIGPTYYYENFYIYDWVESKDYYNNLFNKYKTNTLYVYTYANHSSASISSGNVGRKKIGTITRDNNNIYFTSKPNDKATYSDGDYILKNLTINTETNNYIIDRNNVFISNNDLPSDLTAAAKSTAFDSANNFVNGPSILIDNGQGRPPIIDKNYLKTPFYSIPVVCDTVYPAYLASVEDDNKYGSDNTIRCSYAKLCGYSWSDMGCN
jgi:hypothetical protein